MDGDVCKDAAIVLGCVGLTAIKATEAEAALRDQRLTEKTVAAVVDAARAAAEPQSDMRGSAEYKRMLVGSLVKRAIEAAVRRTRGEPFELSHIYA
jgi:carbon-monoxide dehydrogenase medium subunit